MTKIKLHSAVSFLIIGTLLSNALLANPLALKANFNPVEAPRQSSLMVLVDSELMQEDQLFDGLIEEYSVLNKNKIPARIERYVDDIRKIAGVDEVQLVTVNPETDPAEIAASLKYQYFQENLKGVVLVGDVPLPVVNKAGNRFVSVYPYTDFEDSAYILNPENYYFERNPLVQNFEPEIWHGLIRFEEKEMYADYFDKNHLFYKGEADYANFNEKIFYLNPDMEAKSLNSSLLTNYDNYTKYAAEKAYNAYSNVLLARLSASFTEGLNESIGEDLLNSVAGDISAVNEQMLEIPDIQTKSMIDKYMSPVSSLFETALQDERKALLGTGRYNGDDYFTPINLIANKDEYYRQYIWQLAMLIEDEIDKMVDQEQKNITILNGAELSGKIYLENGEELDIDPQYFVNNSYRFTLGAAEVAEDAAGIVTGGVGGLIPDTPSQKIAKYDLKVSANFEVDSPDDCRLFQGGALGGPLAKTVEWWRRDFVQNPGADDEALICLKEKITKRNARKGEMEDPEYKCSQFYGRNIKDEAHTKLANLEYKGQVTHEACFNMRPLSLFEDLIDGHNRKASSNDQYNITHSDSINLEKANHQVDSERIILSSAAGGINLAEVLEKLPNYNSEPKDWNAWSSYLLANPVQTRFETNKPFSEDSLISRVVLNVNPIHKSVSLGEHSEATIKSVIRHKDPSPELIELAVTENEILQLPVDQIRYVTFIDKQGNKQEIVYPNPFRINSIDDFIAQLQDLELTFSEMSGVDYSGRLSAFVSEGGDMFNEEKDLQLASKETLNNLLDWGTLSLNQKYTEILRSAINLDKESYVPNIPDTFEVALLDIRADKDSLIYELIGEDTFGLNSNELMNPQDSVYKHDLQAQSEADADKKKKEKLSGFEIHGITEWINDYLPAWYEEVTSLSTIVYPPDTEELIDLPEYSDLVIADNVLPESIILSTTQSDLNLAIPSDSEIVIEIKNALDQRVVGEALILDVDIPNGVEIKEDIDADSEKAGLQIFTTSGIAKLPFRPTQAGDIEFKVSLQDIQASLSIKVHESLSTQIAMPSNTIKVANNEGLEFSIRTVGAGGEPILTPRPRVVLDNPALGSYSQITEADIATEFKYRFRPNKRAGRVGISVESGLTYPLIQEIIIQPEQAKALRFDPANQEDDLLTFNLKALDEYGNLATRAENNLDISLSNPDKVIIQSSPDKLTGGKAQILIKTKPDKYGNTYLKVESEELDPAYQGISLATKLSSSELKNLSLTALYLELQSSVSGIDSIGQHLLSQGKSQVISTLSTDLNAPAPVFYLHPSGAVEILDKSKVQTSLTISDSLIQAKIYDTAQRELATVNAKLGIADFKGIIQDKFEISEEGIYLENRGVISDEELLAVVELNELGMPSLSSKTYSFELCSNSNYFSLSILEANREIGRLIYALSTPGAIKLLPANHPDIKYEPSVTLSSSNDSLGFKFFDPSVVLQKEQLPNSGQLRLENNIEEGTDLISLRDGHKATMLFSAGQSAGEANRPYLSEAGIVLGDPLIKLGSSDNFSVENQYAYDIGEYLGRTGSPITEIIDRPDYLLLAEENGRISRLSKKSKALDLNFAQIPSGISKIEEFGDSLLVLTKDACVQNDSCLYRLFDDGKLEQIPLELDSKVVQIFAEDLTGDGDKDLAVLTDSKKIFVFLQTEEGIQAQGSFVASTFASLDSSQNLAPSIWVQYKLSAGEKLSQFPLRLSIDTNEGGSKELAFETLASSYNWNESSLISRDVNGERLESGDIVEYNLYLKNTGPRTENAYFSLPIDSRYEIFEDSLNSEAISFTRVDDESRPYLLKGVSIDRDAVLQLSFQAEYHLNGLEKQALVNMVVDDEGYPADDLPDFKLIIPNTGVTTYYYSDYNEDTNRLVYRRKELILGRTTSSTTTPTAASIGQSEEETNSSAKALADTQKEDSDGDGIPDAFDTTANKLDRTGDNVESFIENATCGGGCLAIPHNRAFLVPSVSSGTPVVGWACPNPIGIMLGRAANSCFGGRFYLSPTLTGELAGSVCLGPLQPLIPNCFTARIGNLGSICDTINEGIQNLMEQATDMIDSLSGSFITVGSGSGSEEGSNIQIPGFPAVITNWVTAQMDEIQRNALDMPDLTLIYPDIADLVQATEETEEVNFRDIESILAKVNALPLFNITTTTHYLKYPQITPDELAKYKGQLTEIVDLNIQEFNRTLESWRCYAQAGVSEADFAASLKSGDFHLALDANTACLSLSAKIFDFNASFETNIQNLSLYRDLPKNIFEAENFLAQYANSILGYAEVILESTASYLSENRAVLKAWQDMFEDIVELVAEFKVILDIFITYDDSCSTCRNQSAEDGWIMFMKVISGAIPTPPVIPIPKLPNLTLDISDVQASINIELPKFEFKPEKLILPNLNGPIIDLPDAPPLNFELEFPSYNLNMLPTIPPPPDIKPYLVALPELPQIQIPVLPSLPAPPDISIDEIGGGFMVDLELGLDVLDKLLRIICLIKKGIVPVNEFAIKSQIESLTARPLDVILPFDIQLGFQFPEVEVRYLEEYKIDVHTFVKLDFTTLNDFAETLTEKFNTFQSNLIDGALDKAQQAVNSVTEGIQSELDNATDAAQELIDDTAEDIQDVINDTTEEAQGVIDEAEEDLREELPDTSQIELSKTLAKLSHSLEGVESSFTNLENYMLSIQEALPENINLVATTKTIPKPEFKGINLDRDFIVPPAFQRQIQSLIAYAEHPVVFENSPKRMIADTSAIPKLGQSGSTQTKTYKIAAGSTGGSSQSNLEFNASSGLYIYNTQTERSENLLAYQAESSKPRKIMNTDLDRDGDIDLIYTRGNEIFFKQKLKTHPDNPSKARKKTYDFEDLNRHNTSSLEYAGVSVSLSHELATFSFNTPITSPLVVDIYKSSFEESLPISRYVINPDGKTTSFVEMNKVPLSDSFDLKKEGFSRIFYQQNSKSKFSIELENQAYIATISTFNPQKDSLETIESRLAITPNICGDKSGPQISIEEGTEIEVAVTNPIDINLSGSSDAQSAISEIYIDTDLETDSDNDGNLINDRDLQGSPPNLASTRFRLSPVNEAKDFQVAVWMIDLAGNSSYKIITIHVLVPKIILDELSSNSASGHISPSDNNIPLHLIRERAGVLNELALSKTDDLGEFSFENLVESDNFQIFNKSNELLFLINSLTGAVQKMDSKANYKVVPAVSGTSPTVIELYENDTYITHLLKVADANQDVRISESRPNKADLLESKGVTVVEGSLGSHFELKKVPGNDSVFPGAIAVLKDNQRAAIIDTNGSIILIDSSLSLEVEALETMNDLQWFILKKGNTKLLDIFVSPDNKSLEMRWPEIIYEEDTSGQETELVEEESSSHQNESGNSNSSQSGFSDLDTNDPDVAIFDYLASLGVLNGIERDGEKYLEPERLLTRAEYASVILKLMCIEPREEAYKAPQAFNDILFQHNLDWFYAETKETKLQGLFEGYLGETDAEGLAPFKPNNTINLAEAIKVILEALELKNVVSLSSLATTNPWYLPYVNISRNISSITLTQDYTGTNTIINSLQAEKPLQELSRREFARIAYNTLLVNNCLTQDLDLDGLPYFYETKNGLNPEVNDALGDHNGDGQNNLSEYETWQENNNNSDSNQSLESYAHASGLIEIGVYIENIVCSTCPCLYRLEYETDILEGDNVFVILKDPSTKAILRKSNTLTN